MSKSDLVDLSMMKHRETKAAIFVSDDGDIKKRRMAAEKPMRDGTTRCSKRERRRDHFTGMAGSG